jgi:hypothetical protein
MLYYNNQTENEKKNVTREIFYIDDNFMLMKGSDYKMK